MLSQLSQAPTEIKPFVHEADEVIRPKKPEYLEKAEALESYAIREHERKMQELAGRSTYTPNADKLEGCTGGRLKDTAYYPPKVKRAKEALVADEYGFYGAWDWIPEQIKKMQESIPCRGVQTEEEWLEELSFA
jgi:hypothetical protein